MRLLARFAGPNGEIAVMEELSTGARLYREGGISQSRVLAGGEAGVEYVRLMADLLGDGTDVLLLGCGGGALATMLHRRGQRVTVVDVNPMSFELARTFFWMPRGIKCVVADMREFVRTQAGTYDAIGIDVGGPSFCYEDVLEPATLARVRGLLHEDARIAVNISCDAPDDPVPGRIAGSLASEGLEVWMLKDDATASNEVNAVILASMRQEAASQLSAMAGRNWSLAQLTT